MSLSLPGGALGESGVDHTHTVCDYMLFYITFIWLTGLLHGVDVKSPKLPQSKGREHRQKVPEATFGANFCETHLVEHLKELAINLA